MSVQWQQRSFGTTACGKPVDLFSFTNDFGVTLSVTNYGGIITSLVAPDKNGKLADIVLGYDSLAEYEACGKFMGCVVGRYANRINHGSFTLEGVSYQLETNPKGHHLHGGSEGFHKQLWQASVSEANKSPLLVLAHHSPHGHGGYPGDLDCKVTYSLSEAGEIEVNYYATSDQPTVVNLTNHSYFNLAGHQHAGENAILDHVAMLNCDAFIPTDDCGIPLSAPVSVSGTPMDFRRGTSLGDRIYSDDQQLKNGGGYDHCWVVNRDDDNLVLAARVVDTRSGRMLEVETTQPGIQCYTGNHVDKLHGKGGALYQFRGSLCLETQHFPDSPNHATFPSTVVAPGNEFHQVTVYRVGVQP